MTSPKVGTEILKLDARGYVLTPVKRREALLEEFERSGMSGASFARMAGVKYATFMNWVAKRRENPPAAIGRVAVPLFEAVVNQPGVPDLATSGRCLCVELPGGSRVRVESPTQLQMAAELVALIARSVRSQC